MASSVSTTTLSRFHNLSDAVIADALGRADALAKAAAAELEALKDEAKRHGLDELVGDEFTQLPSTDRVRMSFILAFIIAMRANTSSACSGEPSTNSADCLSIASCS